MNTASCEDNELTEEFMLGLGFIKTRGHSFPFRRYIGSITLRANVCRHYTLLSFDKMYGFHYMDRVSKLDKLRTVFDVLGININFKK